MAKYIDADKLIAEIERRRLHFNKEAEKYQALNNGYSQNCYGARDALRDLENLLDTLSEEPDKSLEEAAENIYKIPFGTRAEDFIAGAEWKKEQMMKEAVECYYGYANNFTKVFLPEETLKGIKEGYVKIVILK